MRGRFCADARWHGFLAAWAYRFQLAVSLLYPARLGDEVDRSFACSGPWAFEHGLREELRLGFSPRIAGAQPAAGGICCTFLRLAVGK